MHISVTSIVYYHLLIESRTHGQRIDSILVFRIIILICVCNNRSNERRIVNNTICGALILYEYLLFINIIS